MDRRIKAEKYEIAATKNGEARVKFTDASGHSVQIHFPAMGVMGFALSLREAANRMQAPIGQWPKIGPYKLSGPPIPQMESTPASGSEGSFGVGVSADLNLSVTWFGDPEAAKRAELWLDIDDTEKLIAGLQAALAALRQKPRDSVH
jgi:hypothetical protein